MALNFNNVKATKVFRTILKISFWDDSTLYRLTCVDKNAEKFTFPTKELENKLQKRNKIIFV